MQHFDTHAHIGLIVNDTIEQIIIVQQAKAAGIKGIISISNNLSDFYQQYKHLSSQPSVFFAAGYSPSEVDRLPVDWAYQLQQALKLEKVIAVGETGLDYHHKYGNKKDQIELFIHHIDIAQQQQKPLIIHNRKASDDVFDILQNHRPQYGAVLHCYGENWSFTQRVLEQFDNVMFSFAGNVTFRTEKNLQEVARRLPIDRILVESESPFMTPSLYHNKRNKPAYLHHTVETIAQLRQEPVEQVAETCYNNALKFFQLSSLD